MELRGPGQFPGGNHRRGAPPGRRQDLPATSGHHRRRGRTEGHRSLDGQVRAGSRGPGDRDRRGGVRPRTVRISTPAPRRCWPRIRHPGPTTNGRNTICHRCPSSAVRLQDHRLRPGLQSDSGRLAGVRLGHHPRCAGHHLARRLHHPGQVPQPHQGGVRRRPGSADPDRRPVLPQCGRVRHR